MGEIQSRSVNHCCGLKMQKPLRRLHCQKIFPKLLSKDKRTNFIGRLLPGKYAGLERVNVFSPPLSNGLQIKVVFNCIYWGYIVTSRVGPITVAFLSLRGTSSFMQPSKLEGLSKVSDISDLGRKGKRCIRMQRNLRKNMQSALAEKLIS